MALTYGFGGHPNDCCQNCGKYLAGPVVYSKQLAKKRVPRTNKICVTCFKALPQKSQAGYRKYAYGKGHEPSATGCAPTRR
jgi:hypothetical protein